MKDLITLQNLTASEINEIIELAFKIKAEGRDFGCPLLGKTLALIFQKPSMRTRVSFEVGIYQLGGQAIYLGSGEVGMGKREAVKDFAKTISRYIDAIVLRTFSQKDIDEFARYATVPVVNGLSDLSHPCQALGDVMTMKEKLGRLIGINLAWVGDGNNVLHSLMHACGKLGVNLSIAAPAGYEPAGSVLKQAKIDAKKSKAVIKLSHSPSDAVKGVDFIYTDVWASMGQESEYKKRLVAFRGFQVNTALLKKAKHSVSVMHCLPAHRGEEITNDAIDGKHSIVYEQAENRLHIQKAILVKLMGGNSG
ncbi:MAG: ornithine carbamoyltransferase [Candidatus Omnitrophota bacterium]